MTDAALRTKALNYLRAGAVTVVHAYDKEYAAGPAKVIVVYVQGHATRHVVDGVIPADGSPPRFTCLPCTLAQPCPHIAAAALVTGAPTDARPTAAGTVRRHDG